MFAVGDSIDISFVLNQGDRTMAPIWIHSEDILDVDHTLYINESGHCLLCRECTECAVNGQIPITSLRTYDVEENVYTVTLTADTPFNEDLLGEQRVFVFSRIVHHVELLFVDDTGNPINFTAIYPGMRLHLQYDDAIFTAPPQEEGTVTIQWDTALNLVDHLLTLNFWERSCVMMVGVDRVDCSQPIVLPLDMTLKPIMQNEYLWTASSNDLELTTNIPSSVKRKVQTIGIQLSTTVIVGNAIGVTIEVMNTPIVQDESRIHLHTASLDIDVTVYIRYNRSISEDSLISECHILDHAHNDTVTPCTDGISLNHLNTDVSTLTVEAESNDTYLTVDQWSIDVVRADLTMKWMDHRTNEEILFGDTLFYPGLRFYPLFEWTDPALTPPDEISIIVQYDEAFHLGDHEITLYPNDECIIRTASQMVSCEEGIQIPWNMTYKSIETNSYSVIPSSFDVTLSGNALTNTVWYRAVQNLTFSFNSKHQNQQNVSAGTFIDIKSIHIEEDRIVQPLSMVHFLNDSLSIDHTVLLYLNTSLSGTPSWTDCFVEDRTTLEVFSCDEGIGPVVPQNEDYQFTLDISSADTYVSPQDLHVNIYRVPLNLTFRTEHPQNESIDLFYPGMRIYIVARVTGNATSPETAMVYIQWDTALHIGDDEGIMPVLLTFNGQVRLCHVTCSLHFD